MDAQTDKKKPRVWQLKQMIKFTLFSASAGLIQAGSYSLMYELLRFREWLSYLIALVLSVLWNFTLNRRFTFQSAANIPKAMLLVALYYCVFTPLSTWWVDRLNAAGWNGYVVLAGTMLINFVTEFLYQRFIVFRGSIGTNKAARRAQAKNELPPV